MKPQYNSTGWLGLIFTVIVCVCFAFQNLGLNFILGNSSYWELQDGDVNQHLSGINMYLSCAWQFPWLAFNSLNYPTGTHVTFVDGIPLFAFLLKIFLPKNHGFINPLGYWVGLNFVFQGVAAWWIARELNVKSWFFLIGLVLFFITYPEFLGRLKQVAIMSHWLILFAIALYVRGCRLRHISALAWTALIFSSFYIHIYLFSMVFGIYIASILSVRHKISLYYMFKLLLPIVILGASLFLFLFPLPSNLSSTNDMNAYAINFLSPFSGGALNPFQADLSHNSKGFSYLGLGIILMFLWIFLSEPIKNFRACQHHWAFSLLMVLFFIYALSGQIYFGGYLIADFNYPHFLNFLTSKLRGSGRFFWPVAYTIMLYSFYKLYNQFNYKNNFILITCLFLIIQYFDILPFYNNLQESKNRPYRIFIDFSILDKILGNHTQYIYIFPKAGCKKIDNYVFRVILPIERYAAIHQMKMNTGFIARDARNCQAPAIEIAQSDKTTSAYFFSTAVYHNINDVKSIMGDEKNIICNTAIQQMFICRYKGAE